MTRVQLRGCTLESMCKKARTVKETNGNTYCYGWFHAEFDPPIPFDECKKCKAFIRNIEEKKE